MKQLGGSFVIAPGFDVKFTGNFSGINGNVVGDRVNVQGVPDVVSTPRLIAVWRHSSSGPRQR